MSKYFNGGWWRFPYPDPNCRKPVSCSIHWTAVHLRNHLICISIFPHFSRVRLKFFSVTFHQTRLIKWLIHNLRSSPLTLKLSVHCHHKCHYVHVTAIRSRTDIGFRIVWVFSPTTIISQLFKLQNCSVYRPTSLLHTYDVDTARLLITATYNDVIFVVAALNIEPLNEQWQIVRYRNNGSSLANYGPRNTTLIKVKQSHYRPWQALRAPGGRGPRFLDNRHMKVVRLSALRTGRQERFLVLISVI
jgi:hypothetical protein